jgi:predicted DNA-binding transcriptional regulator YafY
MRSREFEEHIKALSDLLMDRFDMLERKIDRLMKRQSCLNGDDLLDTQDLCLLLKASKRTLQRYRKNEVLPFHYIEGKVYYKLSDIHEFISKSFKPAKGKGK